MIETPRPGEDTPPVQDLPDWLPIQPIPIDIPPVDARLFLYLLHLDEQSIHAPNLCAQLSASELAYATRFAQVNRCEQAILIRATLKWLIALHDGPAPREQDIRTGANGKPWLAQVSGEPHPLRFNLSHSGDQALFGLTWRRHIGVDIEHPRPLPQAIHIARRFLHPSDLQLLLALPEEQRERAFRRLWVRAEALVKAKGRGIAGELGQQPVGLDIAVVKDSEKGAWWMKNVEGLESSVGAICVQGLCEDHHRLRSIKGTREGRG